MSSPAFILALNAGSSSLKFALFHVEKSFARVAAGSVERIGQNNTELKVKSGASSVSERKPVSAENHAHGLELVLTCASALLPRPEEIAAIGHRVVHGGPRYFQPERVAPALLQELQRLSPFDPEHLPSEIALIQAMEKRFPALPQIACFDTFFHRDLPRVAQQLPLPRRYEAAGLRRYGFHGISCEFLMEELLRLGDLAASKGRIVLGHLGSGASLTAVRAGRSFDTSMGFTPAAGLVMATRTGDVDPGLSAYLAATEKMSADRFQTLVNHESGLLGISETSGDMQTLLAGEATDRRMAEAVALFCYQAKKWLGGYTAALGGLDTLVFSGGIGENASIVRARICEGLGFLGIKIDERENLANSPVISERGAPVTIRVIPTDEELMIARSTARLLHLSPP